LTGKMQISSADVVFKNINIDDIIQSAINRYVNDSLIINKEGLITDFKQFTADVVLQENALELQAIKANSDSVEVIGSGKINWLQRLVDLQLKVTLLQGWNMDHDVVKALQKVQIPLHIYGEVGQLKYDVDIRSLVTEKSRSHVSERVQKELKQLLDKLKKRDDTAMDDEQSKQQIKENVKELFNKLKNKLDSE